MAKPELGMKRTCLACAAKFYDLNRNPVTCPKCGTPFAMEARAVRPEVQDEEEAEGLVPAGAEFVPLDAVDADPAKVVGDDVDLDDEALDDDDDTFLAEEEDEDDGDVSDLIDGDLEEDEDS